MTAKTRPISISNCSVTANAAATNEHDFAVAQAISEAVIANARALQENAAALAAACALLKKPVLIGTGISVGHVE